MNNDTTGFSDMNKVSMMPDILKAIEIGFVDLGIIHVTKKTNRTRWKALCANQLTFSIGRKRFPFFTIASYRHAKTGRLDFTATNRHKRITKHEATDNIRTARDTGKMKVVFKELINEIKLLR